MKIPRTIRVGPHVARLSFVQCDYRGQRMRVDKTAAGMRVRVGSAPPFDMPGADFTAALREAQRLIRERRGED